jgi:hypothetical protein
MSMLGLPGSVVHLIHFISLIILSREEADGVDAHMRCLTREDRKLHNYQLVAPFTLEMICDSHGCNDWK